MISAIIAFLTTYKALLLPLATAFIGWLLPSPMEQVGRAQEKTHAAEDKADTTRGDMDDLDHLP